MYNRRLLEIRCPVITRDRKGRDMIESKSQIDRWQLPSATCTSSAENESYTKYIQIILCNWEFIFLKMVRYLVENRF